jgi:rhodanese-related sulfurtransferase
MAEKIDHAALRRLLDDGAQLVEVLPAEEYAEEHLPAAINIPLKALDAATARRPRPVAPGHRLLLRLHLRHEPASRVPARDPRL